MRPDYLRPESGDDSHAPCMEDIYVLTSDIPNASSSGHEHQQTNDGEEWEHNEECEPNEVWGEPWSPCSMQLSDEDVQARLQALSGPRPIVIEADASSTTTVVPDEDP